MRLSRKLILGGALVVGIAALGIGQAALDANAAQQVVQAPRFEVDPFWPKPLPNGWVMGTVIGVGVDSRDHVYIIHRHNQITPATEGAADQDPPLAECCRAAPPVLEFDPQGNLMNAWGGPVEGAPYVWPGSNHGITVDSKDNVWIGGNGPTDSHVLKFTRDGRYLMTIGEPAVGTAPASNSTTRFGRVAKISMDEEANEAYFADGYQNRRVAVVDMNTGGIKRFWGAYGNRPDDDFAYTDTRSGASWSSDQNPQQQFRTPVHCADPSNDGFVYVCDRPNNRIQVFRKDGMFVKEAFYSPKTLGDGSTWDVAFSRDPEQRYMYIADGKNMRVNIVDRQSLQLLSSFGSGGRYPGQFQAVHSLVTDSQGNIFTTETYEGRRLQKFVYKGLAPVTRLHQGTPWPATPR